MANQLNFKLSPPRNSKRYYFIPHSGVSEAWGKNLSLLNSFLNSQQNFFLIYFAGDLGSGKSYLIDCCVEEAEERGCPQQKIKRFEFSQKNPADDEISNFISEYEFIKANGGIIYLESPFLPLELTTNPHLLSRIKQAEVSLIKLPQEEELPALIDSLLERNNLKLKDKDINYILKRSATDPLSLSLISARISELLLSSARASKRDILKKVFE